MGTELRRLSSLPPLEEKLTAEDLVFVDQFQSDGTFISKKLPADSLSGGAVSSDGLFQQDSISDKDRFVFELQGGEPVTTARVEVENIKNIAGNNLKIGANVDSSFSDLSLLGNILANEKREIKSVWEERFGDTALSSRFNEILQSISPFPNASNQQFDIKYLLPESPNYNLKTGDHVLVNANFNRGKGYYDHQARHYFTFNIHLVYRLIGSDAWIKYNSFNITYPENTSCLNWVFKTSQNGNYEFNIQIQAQSASSLYLQRFNFSNIKADVLFEKIPSESTFDVYGVDGQSISNLRIVEGENWPSTVNNTAPLRLNGLKVGEKVLLKFALILIESFNNNSNSGLHFQYRKVGDDTWIDLDDVNSLLLGYQRFLYSTAFVDLFTISENGDYEFSFKKKNWISGTLYNPILTAESVDSGQIQSKEITINLRTTLNALNDIFEEDLEFDLDQGESILLTGSIPIKLNNLNNIYPGLSVSFNNGAFTGLTDNSIPFTSLTNSGNFYSNNSEQGEKNTYPNLFFERVFTANEKGTYRFKAGFVINREINLLTNGVAKFIGVKLTNLVHTYNTHLRVSNESDKLLHNEENLSLVFSNREIELDQKTVEANYTEFSSSSEKSGANFFIGEVNSFGIRKGSDNSLFSFRDSLEQSQSVYTTFSNLINVINSRVVALERLGADRVRVNASSFDGFLNSQDTNLQSVLNKLDNVFNDLDKDSINNRLSGLEQKTSKILVTKTFTKVNTTDDVKIALADMDDTDLSDEAFADNISRGTGELKVLVVKLASGLKQTDYVIEKTSVGESDPNESYFLSDFQHIVSTNPYIVALGQGSSTFRLVRVGVNEGLSVKKITSTEHIKSQMLLDSEPISQINALIDEKISEIPVSMTVSNSMSLSNEDRTKLSKLLLEKLQTKILVSDAKFSTTSFK